MKKTRRILVPLDFSGPSLAALGLAVDMAIGMGKDLILLHVLSWPTPDLGYFTPLTEKEQALQKMEAAFLRAVAGRDWPADKRPKFEVREGLPPAVEILYTAAKEKIDMIIMGTHGRRGVPHLFLGSVAERVIREAPCPVITCRQRVGAPIEAAKR
jgi:nucleotide-binding universal stress UspA family protein